MKLLFHQNLSFKLRNPLSFAGRHSGLRLALSLAYDWPSFGQAD